MSELFSRVLALHSAPAICGIKASNLISLNLDEISNLINDIKEVNQNYNPSLYIKILQVKNRRALILVYRKNVLEECLFDTNKLCFLYNLGYPMLKNIDLLLNHLKTRLNNSDSFPHEIGIFLGYELSDVLGFINHKDCVYSGLWKVYSNKEENIKLFNKFKQCTKTVVAYLNNGYKLESFMK